jgi:hypothetical protein
LRQQQCALARLAGKKIRRSFVGGKAVLQEDNPRRSHASRRHQDENQIARKMQERYAQIVMAATHEHEIEAWRKVGASL